MAWAKKYVDLLLVIEYLVKAILHADIAETAVQAAIEDGIGDAIQRTMAFFQQQATVLQNQLGSHMQVFVDVRRAFETVERKEHELEAGLGEQTQNMSQADN